MPHARPTTGPRRFTATDARLYAELRRYGADEDAALYAELSRFCQEGENAGQPRVTRFSEKGVEAIRKALADCTPEELDGLYVWVNPKSNLAVIDQMDWHDGKGGKKIGAVVQKEFGKDRVKWQNEGAKPEGNDWIELVKDRLENKHAERFSEGGNALHGVAIFAAGTHRGKTYTPADLNDMVRNFKQVSTGKDPLIPVPAVLGHEESQEYLERSDLPAAAWPDRIYRQGKKLLADFDKPPAVVRKLLANRAYRTVSSEVYDEPPEGVPGTGKVLRRIAFLGGDIPQIKTLGDIVKLTDPAPESLSESHGFAAHRRVLFKFSECRQSKTPGAFWVFGEISNPGEKMDREKLIAALAEHGIDTSTLTDAVPDEALAEMLRVCEDKDQGGTAEMDDEPDGDEGKDKSDPFAEFADDELPEPKDEEEKKDYAEKARKYADRVKKFAARGKKFMEKYCAMGKMDDAETPTDTTTDDMDDEPTPANPQPKKTTVTHQFNERQVAAIVRREVAAALKGGVKNSIDQLTRFSEQQLATQKKATIETFCETRLKQGKILPSELDRDNPANLFDRLLRADASQTVRKFRESGKDVALTELDLQMREIDTRPAFKFGEKLPSKPSKTSGKGGSQEDDPEVEKVKETFERFSEKFPKGTTEKTIVDGFKAEKKHFPELTADDFLEALTA